MQQGSRTVPAEGPGQDPARGGPEGTERQGTGGEPARLLGEWRREERDMKVIYPGFSLDREAKDPAFSALLCRGVPMRQAFEAAHFDDLVMAAVAHALERAERRRAPAAPPQEQAVRGRPGVLPRRGGDMTRAERERIARRVLRGERVSLAE